MTIPPPPPPVAWTTPPKNGLGVWALVLGILSLVCCGFFAAVPAIILGVQSKKAEEQGQASNGNLGQIGMILGIIGCALSVLSGILYATGALHFNFSTGN